MRWVNRREDLRALVLETMNAAQRSIDVQAVEIAAKAEAAARAANARQDQHEEICGERWKELMRLRQATQREVRGALGAIISMLLLTMGYLLLHGLPYKLG